MTPVKCIQCGQEIRGRAHGMTWRGGGIHWGTCIFVAQLAAIHPSAGISGNATICWNCKEPATVDTPGGPVCAACHAEFERHDLAEMERYLADNPGPPKSFIAVFTGEKPQQ